MKASGLCGACTGILVLLIPVTSARGQDDLRVSCLPDRAVARSGDTVRVTAWVASAAGPITRNVAVRWVASAGRIDDPSLATRWQLAGADLDRRHTATVEVTVDGNVAGACSLGVWVAGEPSGGVVLRGEYITGRAFLTPGQVGQPGFGLYSYFLMREPANALDRARAASFVSAFLDVLVGIADQEDYVERRRLNGSYLPVTMAPPARLTAQARAAWALDHYDYEHAKRLLSLYPTLAGQGPFIVAVPAPLRSQVTPMLPWDFTVFDATAIAEGVNRFLNQAAQLYDWQNQGSLQKLREQVLTIVAGMFVGRATAENWMQLVR